ncbi:MAG: hypothetical protein AAFV88_26360, partial [Planctomycetota bacterium]
KSELDSLGIPAAATGKTDLRQSQPPSAPDRPIRKDVDLDRLLDQIEDDPQISGLIEEAMDDPRLKQLLERANEAGKK